MFHTCITIFNAVCVATVSYGFIFEKSERNPRFISEISPADFAVDHFLEL